MSLGTRPFASFLLVAAAVLVAPAASRAALFARDLDGNAATIEAYYDDALDLTWLADASLAETPNHFGIPMISTSGEMSWDTAQNWILAVNGLNGGAGWLGVSTWRLPDITPVSGVAFDTSLSFDGSTDVGYQVSAPIGVNNPAGQSAGSTASELAYQYYNNFGALGGCFGSGSIPTSCPGAAASGFNNATNAANLPLFRNAQGSILWAGPTERFYWTGVDLGPSSTSAWSFATTSGLQSTNLKTAFGFVWLVASGDHGGPVTPPPPPSPPVLQGRDLDGVPGTFEAYYDPVLDVTWLADADLAGWQEFGVPGIPAAYNGAMDWPTAQAWITAMNVFDGGVGWLGVNTWRMPVVTPVDGIGFDMTVTYDGSSDVGYQLSAAVDANLNQSGQSAGSTSSELAYHYYNNFGATGWCAGVGVDRTHGCMLRPVHGISNASHTGNLALFSNIQSGTLYWTGTESVPGGGQASAFFVTTETVGQSVGHLNFGYVWPVAPGDVGAAQVPAFHGLGSFLLGGSLALLGSLSLRRASESIR
jgi:hypothetical protein